MKRLGLLFGVFLVLLALEEFILSILPNKLLIGIVGVALIFISRRGNGWREMFS